ncbi:hypothetical protein WA026_000819 [Henosepilachna vigintioctopunctata]|uniref:mRNA cap guanine-N(7) methyltransferase n=1 Tax=Henosepilachna vigintioctopunctata TaxID=420089 RepID=A0AAW1V1N6_9CUCU
MSVEIISYGEAEDNTTTEDLEKALMVAAADADARNEPIESTSSKSPRPSEPKHQPLQNSSISNSSLKRCSDGEKKESPKKRKISEDISTSGEGYANVVASHYNQIEEKGLQERSKSRIVFLRNFHNWIKSMLINEYLSKIKLKKKYNAPLRVLDIGCGKGGDLLKWKKANITHLICSDIAAVSLEQCKNRYSDMKERSARDRNGGNLYTIEYISADCSRVRLREKYSDPSVKLDIVSCQFAFHYSFESLPQAECMLRNVGECLQAGGYFIGTIPDANDLVARAKRENSNTYGNDVYKVLLDFDVNKPPLFGAKYNFYLDGVVDCPEFLVHFPTFIKLAKKYGLKLVKKEKFYDFFNTMKREGSKLLSNMSSLETYPPFPQCTMVGSAEDDYVHAERFLSEITTNDGGRNNVRLGTLSKSEWEASSLYLTFAFEKVKNTWNADGTPCYEI